MKLLLARCLTPKKQYTAGGLGGGVGGYGSIISKSVITDLLVMHFSLKFRSWVLEGSININ